MNAGVQEEADNDLKPQAMVGKNIVYLKIYSYSFLLERVESRSVVEIW